MLMFCSYSYIKVYHTKSSNMTEYVGHKNSALAAAPPPPAVPPTVIIRNTQQHTVKQRNIIKNLNNETTKAPGNLLPSPTSFTCTDGRTVRKHIRLHMPLTKCERSFGNFHQISIWVDWKPCGGLQRISVNDFVHHQAWIESICCSGFFYYSPIFIIYSEVGWDRYSSPGIRHECGACGPSLLA